jgi:putative radical SAM enzyme (TIGR03279 family)
VGRGIRSGCGLLMTASQGGLVSAVVAGSIGAEVGIEPGDRLLTINGHALRDVIDYRFYGAEEELVLEIEREGQRHRLEIERDYDEDLGLEFAELTFDGLIECDNRCPFCFVAQMPRGLRRSLYVRDDDYRYSFVSASFVTLTNLTDDDWARIGEQRLSPLFVSIHATDPEVRRACLGNPDAPDVVAQIDRLGALGIAVHGQVVIVPGLNDGAHLARTITDCAALWPTLESLALVPVGLTRYHRGSVRTLTPDEARAALAQAQAARLRLGDAVDGTWLFAADELYLLGGEPIPGADYYDEPAQRDNGVGLVRELLDDWEHCRSRLHPPRRPRYGSVILVCGALAAPLLQPIAVEFARLTGIAVIVQPILNRFFGETVTVSGLLTAQDLFCQLPVGAAGDLLVLPRVMFNETGEVTLDDVSREAIAAHYGVAVRTAGLLSEVARLVGAR